MKKIINLHQLAKIAGVRYRLLNEAVKYESTEGLSDDDIGRIKKVNNQTQSEFCKLLGI